MWGGVEIQISPEDNYALLKIIETMSSVTDAEFKNQIDEIKNSAPSYIKKLKGVWQSQPHGDIDAFDHTFNTFDYLDTTDLDPNQRLIVRLTMLLHDIAKVGGSDDQDHPRSSGEIATFILKNIKIDQGIKDSVVRQVTYHDFLGDLSRKDHRGFFYPQQMIEFFEGAEDLKLHRKVVMADVASIPGLRTYLPNIERTYQRLVNNLDRFEWRYKTPEEGGDILDVVKVDEVIDKVITHTRDFDDINIYEDCSDRKAGFEVLSKEEQEILEKFIIEASRNHDDNFLRAMQATGQEMDIAFVELLEKKYDTKLDELRISTQVFGATYGSWYVNYYIRNELDWESGMGEIKNWLSTIADITRQLAKETVFATHCTPSEAKKGIVESGELYGSDGDQFEGNGVYVGLMGSYRMWRGYEHMYSFHAKMADMFPIIVDFNYPKMMGNVLCQYLDIFSYNRAIPQGVIWRHEKFDDLDITSQKTKLLSDVLGGVEVVKVVDSQGTPTLIVDTDEPPIVWASLARALGLPKVIAKCDLPYQSAEPFSRKNKIGSTSIRIRGIGRQELEDELY